MKKYEEYKNSGVEWIGEIPEGWNLSKLKYVSLLNPSNKKPLVDDAEIGYMPMECLRYGRIEKRSAKLSELSTGLNYFEDGDLVMAKVTPCFENGNIAIAENLTNGCALGSSEVFVFRTKEIETKWLFYIMRHESLIKELASTMSGVGGLKRIDSEYMMNCSIPMPSLKEREGIISYLDSHCSKIDEMIEAKAKQIDDLKEYRKSLISEVVTKGLNPNVEMKESGIPYVGSVPISWFVSSVKRFSKVFLGKMLSSEKKKDTDSLEDYICAKDVHFDGINWDEPKQMYFSPEEKAVLEIKDGDLLIVEGGAGAGGSYVAKVPKKKHFYIQNSINCVRTSSDLNSQFLYYWICSLYEKKYVDYVCNVATIPHFTKEKVENMPIAVPARDEQDTIVAYLDDKCTKIADLMKLLDDEIKELQKYKTSIISEAVTGKIKVC